VDQLFITGGSGGLGQAIVETFASPCWEVTAPSRHEFDVSDLGGIQTKLKSRKVDLLVCAAGITGDLPLMRLDEMTWADVFAVNYQGAANSAAAVLPQMVERGSGHVIFISSFAALHPAIGQAAYATAKAALLGLTTSLAQQYGHHGIRINAILPGFLETRMAESVTDKRKSDILADHTLGRFNTPQAVAKFIRFLHEDLAHTSGQVFQLDSRIS
jgi:3-oxoacyl-[acyl-carrier protein] reductase